MSERLSVIAVSCFEIAVMPMYIFFSWLLAVLDVTSALYTMLSVRHFLASGQLAGFWQLQVGVSFSYCFFFSQYTIKWSIMKKVKAYKPGSKRCNLCLEEKLLIMKAKKTECLNKRSDLISKCRHVTRYLLNQVVK